MQCTIVESCLEQNIIHHIWHHLIHHTVNVCVTRGNNRHQLFFTRRPNDIYMTNSVRRHKFIMLFHVTHTHRNVIICSFKHRLRHDELII